MKKSASEAVAKSHAKAKAEGRVRLAGYLSAEGSARLDRIARDAGSRVAAIEAALEAFEAGDPTPEQAVRILARFVKERA